MRSTRSWSRRLRAHAAVCGSLAACLLGSTGAAAETGELLQILKDKGVLTDEEFDKLQQRQQMRRDSDREETKFRASEAAKDELKAATKDDVKGGFRDGFVFESADKQHSIAVRGRAELDYRKFGGPDGANADTFDLRRSYLGFEGKLYERFDYRLRGNFSTLNGPTTSVCTAVGPTSSTDATPLCTQTAGAANPATTALDEAWLNIRISNAAQLKFGQFKMPFSFEQLQTELYTDFQERSMGDVISPGKERGVQLWGYPKDGLFYALALSNGQGINANETNNTIDNRDLLARASVNVPELIGRRDFVVHLGASYSDGKQPPGAAFSGRTEARGVTFFTPAAFTGQQTDRTRHGLDVAFAYGPFKLQSEWMQAAYSGRSAASSTTPANDYDKTINARYASLTWMITGEHYADFYRNGLFGRPRPVKNVKFGGGGGPGAWELGVRYSRFDAADFQTSTAAFIGSGVKPPTSANGASAWTMGIKWLPNPNVRLMLNYVQTKFDTPVTVASTGAVGTPAVFDNERAVTFRAQVDF